jgi:tetratricopeptide (TPR) repeat protein
MPLVAYDRCVTTQTQVLEGVAGVAGVQSEPRPSHASIRSAEIDQVLSEAESAAAANRPHEALNLIEQIDELVRSSPPLRLRALLVESWALMSTGDTRAANSLLEQATWIAATPDFTDADRAEVLFRLGCCRLRQSQVGNATALFTVALEDAQRSTLPTLELRATILQWRARCWLRQHLPAMATQDVERALELAEGCRARVVADVSFQASVVAERQGNWLLARMYAETALELYRTLEDDIATNKVLNNLGGINFLLGASEEAIQCLTESIRIARSMDDAVGIGYALSTLAETLLRTGDPEGAEDFAGQALTHLEGADAHLTEIGGALLTLGRATAEQDRLPEAEHAFRRAEECFGRADSTPHQAEAWIAQGELAEKNGDQAVATNRYRRAALALRNVHL